MKFYVFLVLALIGYVAGAQLPDSATQGPNPQDIATPEPEYIDIDEPAPAPAAPRPVAQLPISHQIARPVARPVVVQAQSFVQRPQYQAPVLVQPQPVYQQLPGHAYSSQSGYQYRRPVYVRRFYRLRRY